MTDPTPQPDPAEALAGRLTVVSWEEHERMCAIAVAREHHRMVARTADAAARLSATAPDAGVALAGIEREAIAREVYRSLHPGGINRHDSERTRESDAADRDGAYRTWDDGRMGRAHYDEAYRVADSVLALSTHTPEVGNAQAPDPAREALASLLPIIDRVAWRNDHDLLMARRLVLDVIAVLPTMLTTTPDAGQREAQERTERALTLEVRLRDLDYDPSQEAWVCGDHGMTECTQGKCASLPWPEPNSDPVLADFQDWAHCEFRTAVAPYDLGKVPEMPDEAFRAYSISEWPLGDIARADRSPEQP